MLMYPTVRKGLITEPTSAPLAHPQDFVHIQDDQSLPDFSFEQHSHQEPRLLSPFQYHPDYQFVSPPSSALSSPTFSSPSSVSHPPSASATDYPAAFDDGNSLEAPSMTPASSYNPSIQVQHSDSPHTSQPYLPQYPQQYAFEKPMLAQPTVANNHSWEGNLQPCNPARIHQGLPRVSHLQDSQKASPNSFSHSSVPAGTPGSNLNSQQTPNSATVPKPLPTPVQTPVQNSFLTPSFQNYDPNSQDGNTADANISMRRAVMEQQQQQQQPRQSDYSLAPSASSVSHNSPATPQTNLDELDDASKAIANGEDQFPDVDWWMDEYLRLDTLSEYGNHNANALSMGIPKLNRTISDIYQDELYNPAVLSAAPQDAKQPTGQNLLGPYRNVFADRLQAANQGHMSARSQSPAMHNREHSPFRQNSHLANEFSNSALQQSGLPTSMSMSQGGLNMGQQNNEPKTISPKDALLDFNESEDTSMPPLFPPNQPDFNLGDALGFRRESSSSFRPPQNYTSMESFPGQYATHVAQQPYPFAQQQQQQGRQQPQQQQHLLNQSPDFAAPIPSLEANNGGMGVPEMTSPQGPPTMDIQSIKEGLPRPNDTSTDAGTYTCTYHGCTLRFETPSKLQKHKRDAHRQTTPGGHLVSRDTTALRNSQAGPHKCERLNPWTGKPCNSVFSRPYDLTRHEDTIHNARKQKVRCHLCTEEKTFSRNDALTRHMRVVHPEVDWPGKQRRRGRD